MAKIIIKNEGISFEIPDNARLFPYLLENTSFPAGCDDGTTSICACTIIKGVENLNPKTHNEIVTLAKLNLPNSPRNRLACQIYVKKGEIELEY
ncbi:MAG: 2Fe-2S iron-sulfur cluster-binding protein [Candidatus Micrarchaeota archaeon]|nr:2Fe-2S iron-sulfur cluster-binding protein [Candidatus Micrarchaeota archaeon]